MDQIILYGSLVLLLISMVYLVWQVLRIRKLKADLGDVVFEVYPTKARKMLILIAGAAFLVLLIVVSVLYLINETPFNFANVLVVALACFAAGRFLSRVTVLYDKGILAYMSVIEYQEIKTYEFKPLKNKRSKILLYLQLSGKRGFQVLVSAKDRKALEKILKQFA